MKNIFLAAMFITLLSCSSSKKAGNNSIKILTTSNWRFSEVQGKAVPQSSKAHLVFSAEKRVSGNAGCNSLSGSYELNGAAIKFSPLAVTKMACVDNSLNEMESNILNALAKAGKWVIKDDMLLISEGNTVVAKLKTTTAEAKTLTGTWELAYMSGGNTLATLFPNKKPTLTFKNGNTEASGNSGCNGFGCTVKVDGMKITFSQIISTMMACEGNGEPIFFKTLESVTSFSVTDKKLIMLKGDIAVLQFVKK